MAKKKAGGSGAAKGRPKRKGATKSAAKRKGATKSPAKRKSATKSAAKRQPAAKRKLIDTGVDKRYVRRSTKGRFKTSDDVGKSLAVDRRQPAKRKSARGQGDRGDR